MYTMSNKCLFEMLFNIPYISIDCSYMCTCKQEHDGNQSVIANTFFYAYTYS